MFLYTRIRNHSYTVEEIFNTLGSSVKSVNLAGDDSIVTDVELTPEQLEQLKTLWGADVRVETLEPIFNS